jgi:energy-coupling factor transport system permease protein
MAFLDSLLVGQYVPTDSLLHKLRPETKIAALVAVIVDIFAFGAARSLILLFLIFLALLKLARLRFSLVIRGLKPLLIVFFITFLLNVFATDGEVIFKWGFLEATREGLVGGSRILARLFLLVLYTTLLTLTTSPIEVADGIEFLLAPFARLKFPVHEFALMMTIALRFIPTLVEELGKIMRAQEARGADFSSASLVGRAKAFVPLLVPLFIITFRRADELAIAMESRCYRGGSGRTKLREEGMQAGDFVSLLLLASISIVLAFVERSFS